MRQRSQENGLLGEARADGEEALGPDSDGLNSALARCAEGDRQGIDDLRAWEDGRLRTMLLRMVGDPDLADSVLTAALDDVFRNAGMLVAVGQGPSDDRVFALVRRHAYAALRTREHRAAAPPPVPLRPAPPAAPPPPAAPASTTPAPAPPAPDPVVVPPSPLATDRSLDDLPDEPSPPAPMALGVATRVPEAPRVRRPGLRDSVEEDGDDEEDESPFDDDEGEPRRRRWLLAAFAWIAAALVGFGIAVVVAGWLMVEPPVSPSPAPPVPSPSPAPPPPPPAEQVAPLPPPAAGTGTGEPPAGARPSSSRDLLGDPLEAPDPVSLPTLPSRVIPAPTAAPRPAAPVPAAPPPAAARPAATPEPSAAAPPPSARPLAAGEPPAREAPVRPAPPAPAPAPPAEVLPAPDRGLSAAAVLPDSARLFIHHSAGDPATAARARALAQRLQQRGASVVIVRPVPFGIRGLSVRFFHEADRAAAAAVLGDVASFGGSRSGPVRPTDFTAFEPAPRPGTIEIWLPGGG